MSIRRSHLVTVAASALVAPLLLLGTAGTAQAAPTGEQTVTGTWIVGEIDGSLVGPAGLAALVAIAVVGVGALIVNRRRQTTL